MHTVDAAETVGRLIEFFPPVKQQQIRSITAEVMVCNARIAELIREDRADEVPDAIAEGEFFEMQSYTRALLDLVIAGRVDREVAADAATNRHDFLVELEHDFRVAGLPAKQASEAEA